MFFLANTQLYRNITRHLHQGQEEPHLCLNDDVSPADFWIEIEKPPHESVLNGHGFSGAAKGQ